MTTREEMVAKFRADLDVLGRYARDTLLGLVACRGHIADPFLVLDEALDDDEDGVVVAEAPRPDAELAHELRSCAVAGASADELVNIVGLAAGAGARERCVRSPSPDADSAATGAECGVGPPSAPPGAAAATSAAASGAPSPSAAAAASAAERGQRRRGKRGGKKHR